MIISLKLSMEYGGIIILDANGFAERLVTDEKFLNQQHCLWKNNPAYFETEITGSIEPFTLERVIELARTNHHAADVLDALLMYGIRGESVSDRSFSMLMSFPAKRRRNYAISLAHTTGLSFYQLQHINRMHICTEAFVQLAFIICRCDCFTSQDVIKLMKESDVPKIVVNSCIDRMHDNMYDKNKVDVLIKWAENS